MTVLTEDARKEAAAPLLALLAEADRGEMVRLLAPVEATYKRKLSRAFARQATAFLSRWKGQQRRLREAEDDTVDWNWEPYFVAATAITDTMFRSATEEAARRSWAAAVGASARRLRLAATFGLPNPLAVAYANEAAGLLVRNVDHTTREAIRAIITEGIRNGDSYGTVAAHIRKLYAGFSAPSPLGHIRDRAELIAVTETGNAYSQATMTVAQALKASGLDMEKAWLTVGDDRVDTEHCKANEAQGWIALDEPFQDGHMRPLAHPGCRCSVLSRRANSG